MTKPREFKLEVEAWRTNALPLNDDFRNDLTTGEVIHVREVVPIPWDNVWAEYGRKVHKPELIQELVERALKGEL